MSANDLQLTHVPPVKVGMLIRRPPAVVFEALVDPAITTRFWFTKSSGKVAPGANIRWDWEMYGASANVSVKEVEDNSRILIEWRGDGEKPRAVEFRFVPHGEAATYVQVTETGFGGDGDAIVSQVADSTGGFSLVLCALKALLEHGVVLTVVLDHDPEGLDR